MKIQTVVKEDHQELVDLWEASVRASHDFLSEADIEFLKPLILNDYLDAVTLRCIKDNSHTILGFLGIAGGNIEMLFVLPANRGQGVGKALTRYAIEELAATKVDVNEQNPQALAFYQKQGFKITGRSPLDGQGKPFPLLHLSL
ncbi:GNAT family N-acetyltransferase [Thalassomonas actiniarum]|uniref:GNAT family N-acetyltransferase n=1 Tax=Thalassomonas actiniarum TaxID=485447 RepID=A0AAE9YQI5_9GAMM|nr:GNAT family N-acetyltransferase [Thalassomonas actiniarum]WDD98832.1 GNAT family N-acetyltransferase [Thalassomonas actiniarum]